MSSKHGLSAGKARQTGQRDEGEDYFLIYDLLPLQFSLAPHPSHFLTLNGEMSSSKNVSSTSTGLWTCLFYLCTHVILTPNLLWQVGSFFPISRSQQYLLVTFYLANKCPQKPANAPQIKDVSLWYPTCLSLFHFNSCVLGVSTWSSSHSS